MNKISRLRPFESFVKKYRIAHAQKWTREEFAEYMGYSIDTIRRKIGKIKDSTGIALPLLPLGGKNLTQEKIQKFETEHKEQVESRVGIVKTSKRYLITSAQNATPVDTEFLKSCQVYCQHNDAELIVIPYRYKNPTSVWSAGDAGHEWWSELLEPYMVDKKIELCENLVALAHIKIVPTATEPLSGFEAYTGTDSAIIGHPKIQFLSVATMSGKPKVLLTTGAITIPNYTDSKAGMKGEFHHSLGAVVVEVDNDNLFHVRHVHASGSDSGFYDLDKRYSPSGVKKGIRASALITGDTHAEFIDKIVEDVTFHNADSIVSTVKPEYAVVHDVTDFYARNHHHRGNDVLTYGKHHFGRNNVQDGLQAAADFMDRISRTNMKVVVVKSNHDEAFDRWLREAEVKNDPENAQFFYYMKYHQLRSIRMNETGFDVFDPFKFWCENPENGKGLSSTSSTIFLKRDESFKVNSVEIGFHGDVGINGARGNIRSLARLSDKMVIGHSHSPGIYEGCYQVGLSALPNLEYKRGPSSWMQTHCLIYPDGKRTLINIINGKWKSASS